MSKYAKLSAGLIAAWLVLTLSASALHLFVNAPNKPPAAVGLAVLTPVVLFLVWFASSPGFRQFVLSLSPRALTLVHSLRIAGFVFLVLSSYKILPAYFALSAGRGGCIIAGTRHAAPLFLPCLAHYGGFSFVLACGVFDLVFA